LNLTDLPIGSHIGWISDCTTFARHQPTIGGRPEPDSLARPCGRIRPLRLVRRTALNPDAGRGSPLLVSTLLDKRQRQGRCQIAEYALPRQLLNLRARLTPIDRFGGGDGVRWRTTRHAGAVWRVRRDRPLAGWRGSGVGGFAHPRGDDRKPVPAARSGVVVMGPAVAGGSGDHVEGMREAHSGNSPPPGRDTGVNVATARPVTAAARKPTAL
jgi:hypothetical protein